MVIHYVNLIGWSDIYRVSRSSGRHLLRCDSVSLKVAIALLSGRWVKREPGTRSIGRIAADLNEPDALFLLPRDFGCDIAAKKIILPVQKSFASLPTDLLDVLAKNDFRILYIGISSPKQNQLAAAIEAVAPDISIVCSGAAVSVAVGGEPSKKRFHLALSRVGLEFLMFARTDPIRSCEKVWRMFNEILLLARSRQLRNEFREFGRELAEN